MGIIIIILMFALAAAGIILAEKETRKSKWGLLAYLIIFLIFYIGFEIK